MPLHICGTPIGNLEDTSLRVLRLLKEADVIAAEDTRHTLKLLSHFEITTPLTSYHGHSGFSKSAKIIELLKQGKTVALVSDAGMPLISDPGGELIRECVANDIEVFAAPGPTAAITALVLSGLDASRFIFEGFLPRDVKKRTTILSEHIDEERTVIFYEAPHHLKETLRHMLDVLGDRQAALARELTKKFEEVRRGSVSELLAGFEDSEPKGEMVIVVSGVRHLKQKLELAWQELDLCAHMELYLEQGMDKKTAMKAVARDRGVSKSEVYKALLM
jgi:16S rRNA (cytidine1402-2'-O)-methyltransferase